MAWKPPTDKVFTAGEIPGKGEISDAEMANLEANRPKKDIAAMFGGDAADIAKQIEQLPEVQQTQLDQLLPVGDGQKIYDWLDELKDSKQIGLGPAVLESSFETAILAEVASGKSFLVSEVLRIAYLKELRPILFYFGIGMIGSDLQVVVTPMPVWEELGQWDVTDISDVVVPSFLTRVRSSVYDFDTSMTASTVRKQMVKLGFVEKHEIIP